MALRDSFLSLSTSETDITLKTIVDWKQPYCIAPRMACRKLPSLAFAAELANAPEISQSPRVSDRMVISSTTPTMAYIM